MVEAERIAACANVLRCFAPLVAVMGCVLVEGVVNAVLVKVEDVITDKAQQMLFVQRDHVVQQLTPATSNPALRAAILPRRLNARSFWASAELLSKRP